MINLIMQRKILIRLVNLRLMYLKNHQIKLRKNKKKFKNVKMKLKTSKKNYCKEMILMRNLRMKFNNTLTKSNNFKMKLLKLMTKSLKNTVNWKIRIRISMINLNNLKIL